MLFAAALCLWFRHRTFTDVAEVYPAADGEFRLFDQLVDHFDNTNTATFKQRYLVNDTVYKKGGPLLVFVGGEGTMSPAVLGGHYAINYFAEQLGGMMVALEHRYYGASQPGPDMSDMRFLSSRQALADYTRFIPHVIAELGLEGPKVVVLGGSYPGSLASMLRVRHPHLVHAALASSGPALWELNFSGYLRHVRDMVAKHGGQACIDAVGKQIAASMRLLDQNASRFAEAYGLAAEQLPASLTDDDRAVIAGTFADSLAYVVQYNKPPGYDGSDYKGDIQLACEKITADLPGDDDFELAKHYAAAMNPFAGGGDVSFAAAAAQLAETKAPNDGRAWFYQTCTEFGSFQTADEAPELGAANTLRVSLRFCHDVFFKDFIEGETADYNKTHALIREAMDFTNHWYGARNQPVPAIYYANGRVDPWSLPAVSPDHDWAAGQFISGEASWLDAGSHCADMYLSWTASAPVREAQLARLRAWLE